MKSIPAQKTLVLARSIVFHNDLSHHPSLSPVCKGAQVRLGTGCKVCVASFPTSDSPHRSAMMTTVYRGKPVYGWVDADDLVTIEQAIEDGVSPYFP